MPSGPVLLPVTKVTVRRAVASEKRFPEALKSERSAGEMMPPMAGDTKSSRNLSLEAWPYYLPKKDSERPLGQDASFISFSKQTIGVADGVGGIRAVDSGVYARDLMRNAHEFVRNHPGKTVDPMRVLNAAFVKSNAGGASTVCIITLKDNSLHAVNLGDSGFMVIRGNKTVYKSPVQQESFNCPFQLGCGSRYMPRHADKFVVDVEAGDVLVAGTDGLFDNLFDDEIVKIVKIARQEGKAPALVAALLGQIARGKSHFRNCVTPFSKARTAAANGRQYTGGKYDDVTVIVGYIS